MATNLKSVKATALTSVITSVASPGVKITGLTYPNSATAANPAGGETITVNGSGFNNGATVYIDTASCTTTYVSSTSLTFTSPAKSIANYHLFVYNTDGSVGMLPGGMVYSSLPTWVTSAGALYNGLINSSYSQSVNATGDGTITYSLTSGSLPNGLSLNTSTGAITGTLTSTQGTSTFTITATDTQNQTASRSFSIAVNNNFIIDYLIVAGGGGGFSGGGGAGGYVTNTNVTLNGGTTFTITVGGGGTSPAISLGGVGGNGSNSVISGSGFTTVTAIGGGGGGSGTVAGQNGGSGGGGGWTGTYGIGVYTGSTYLSQTRQGYDGGQGYSEALGGGGGGASAGSPGSGRSGGQGGNDYYSSITGSSLPYCGGGAGSGGSTPGSASSGGTGGAAGYPSNVSKTDGGAGTVNRGGGGGGTRGDYGSSQGGSGGSGVVIIRYANTYSPASSTTGSPTVTTPTGYRVYTFTTSGSITF